MPAIETDGLTRRFGDFTAVDDLDLTVQDGEVFGFLGPNGAGKSTTINMLLGFLKPTEGSATVLGNDATRQSRAVRQRTGLLPEGFELYENLTGREHVVSAIETKGADDDPDHLIERVGLEPEAARRRAGGYSKGMTQRLTLAVALVGEPDLLILDEPSSGLDPKGAKLLREIVREEADRGATVFFSSHILGQVEQVCDRVGIMNKGEMVAVDTIDALRDQTATESVVEVDVASVPDTDAVARVEGVDSVTVTDTTLEITVDRPAAKMPALRALDAETEVTDIAIEDASLESLFERYTGDADAGATGDETTQAAAVADGGDDA
ncbi:ABC transporter ATP-binding protein [Halobacterium jilantaiense]|uniref:ABC-2 type transport system ATP-binding protein n=1 Tax=Halobacterium jilantaiense TaxID=355548 RepID=A0A1I0PQ08_9EURY|nr:ABC transporter ATP-binding protein [Halobacterium jilantaiense]SEW16341.1 ABC-2 type transport system ATP-binding protein [Halobacterium jilantaiense]